MSDVHGHDVLEMMKESNKAYTEEKLLQIIGEKFGTDARFYTCFAQGLTAKELVGFLREKGKFILEGDKIRINPETMCQN